MSQEDRLKTIRAECCDILIKYENSTDEEYGFDAMLDDVIAKSHIQTLKDVGGWLESRRFDIYCWEAETVDGFEALKRGEMPKEV